MTAARPSNSSGSSGGSLQSLLSRHGKALGVAAVVYIAGACGAYAYVQHQKGAPSDAERLQTFDSLAPKWDALLGCSEARLGMDALRLELLQHARGQALEVGAGSGRNLAHYPPAVRRLTLTDAAEGMAAQLRAKATLAPVPVADVRVAAGEALPFAPQSFDTVVQTHVLCSVREPAAELRELLRVCRPGGRLLLLEHGRAGWQPLDWYLDALARLHARRWGCWWNRDVAGLVRDAMPPNARVTHRRAHLGTSHMFVVELASAETLPAAPVRAGE